ncbi:hypothetical protein ACUTR7_07450 [Delftia sp. NA_296.1]|uniref:hypothetical protein n=1 Tax=Delftia sp. NA_296.1 TaxID=3415648 RepID=UPI0040453009
MEINKFLLNHKRNPEDINGRLLAAWMAILFAIFFAYSQGLDGSFIFDDFPNIVDSDQLVLKNLSPAELWRAAFSGDAGPLRRPVPVLSFALNIYFSGLDPWYFKLTNIFVHLSCTIAIGLLVSRFLRAWNLQQTAGSASEPGHRAWAWGGLLAASIWGLHPLNLTSVLYVVQRMTSLAALFGLLAVAVYIEARSRSAFIPNVSNTSRSGIHHYASVVVLLVLSCLSKESGLLFIPLIILCEFFLFKFKNRGSSITVFGQSLQHWAIYAVILVAVCILIWITPRILDTTRIPYRDFSTPDRLLTQSRVLVFYLSEFFIPQISEMSLYHDDIEISRSFWQPLTTTLAISFVSIVSLSLFKLRKNYPILLFSWLWFLISHSLESSIFPLELVHEHRNYFATAGFCIAFAYFSIPFFVKAGNKIWIIAPALIILLGSSTAIRAMEWSSPLVLATMEASRHPLSMRANYQLGSELIFAADQATDKRSLLAQAKSAFEAAAASRSDSVSSYFGLLAVKFALAKEEDAHADVQDIVDSLIFRLKNNPAEAAIPAHIAALSHCQLSGPCSLQDMDALALITAPIENPSMSPSAKGEVLKMAAEYAIARANDWTLAQTMVEEALNLSDVPSTRIVYAQVLRNRGDFQESRLQLDVAKRMDGFGRYTSAIERENLLLKQSTSEEKAQ